MTRFDEYHGLLFDEGMMAAHMRTQYPCTLWIGAMLIPEGPGKHENFFSTPVMMSNESLTRGPMDKGRPFLVKSMECLDSELALARKPGLFLGLQVHKFLIILSKWA